jgi:hypothetical protein
MMMRRFTGLAGLTILAMVSGLLLTPQRASSMSFTWSGAVSIQWTDPCNWQPKNACTDTRYPGSDGRLDDIADIENPTSGFTEAAPPASVTLSGLTVGDGITLDAGAIDVRNGVLELDVAPGSLGQNATVSGQGRLLVTNGASLALSGPFEGTPDATLELSTKGTGGSLSGQGRMDGGGTLDWTGGSLSAALGIPQNSHLRIEGSPSKLLTGTLAISGTAAFSDTGQLLFGFNPPGIITNTGTFTAYLGTHFQGLSCCNNPPRFENQGALAVERLAGQATASATTMEGVALHNVAARMWLPAPWDCASPRTVWPRMPGSAAQGGAGSLKGGGYPGLDGGSHHCCPDHPAGQPPAGRGGAFENPGRHFD